MPDPKPTCSVPDCERESFCKGMCEKHYRKIQRADREKRAGPCVADGCSRKARTRGRCHTHYAQWWREQATRPSEEWFYAQVNKEPGPDGCWVWKDRPRDEYPRTHGEKCHRLSYEFAYGPIPDGAVLLHKCDRPHCCRPDHLTAGTRADNIRDMVKKGRNPRGVRHKDAKLYPDAVREIRRSDEPHTVLAERFGVSPSAVRQVRVGYSWKHVV